MLSSCDGRVKELSTSPDARVHNPLVPEGYDHLRLHFSSPSFGLSPSLLKVWGFPDPEHFYATPPALSQVGLQTESCSQSLQTSSFRIQCRPEGQTDICRDAKTFAQLGPFMCPTGRRKGTQPYSRAVSRTRGFQQ